MSTTASAPPSGAATPMRSEPRRAGRYGLSGLLRSEWTKMRTVRSTVWTLGVTVVVGVGISALATGETRAHWSTMSQSARLSFNPTQTSLTALLFFCQLAIGILGVLVMSAEYGTGTIRATFAAAPRRPLVLTAKIVAFGTVALVVSEIVAFVSFLLGQALLSAPATHATFVTPGALRAVVGTGLYLCVIGLFALGLATIIRHTAGAISAFVGLLLVLPIVITALPAWLQRDIVPYLPLHIGTTMMSVGPVGPNTLAPWTGFIVLCVYAVALLVIGGVLLVRRDA